MLKAVLFDFDGTIIDSLKHHLNSWKKAFSENGLELSDEEVVKKVFYQFGEEKNPKYKINDKILKLYLESIDEAIQEVEIHENIKETLESLKNKGLKMAIVSFVEKERIVPILKKFEIDSYFQLVLGYGDVEKVKPDPEVADKAMSVLGVKPEETLLVGDTGIDIQTGKNALTLTAFYNPEINRLYTDMELFRDSKPDIEFHHFDELLPKIQRFL